METSELDQRLGALAHEWSKMSGHVLAVAGATQTTEGHLRRQASAFRIVATLFIVILAMAGAITVVSVQTDAASATRYRLGDHARWLALDAEVRRLAKESHACAKTNEVLGEQIDAIDRRLAQPRKRPKHRRR